MFQKLFIWPLFAAIMGFALGGSFVFGLYGPYGTVQHINQEAKHHAAEHDAKSKKEETDEALAYYTLWLMVFTGILAVATVGLGGATLGLYFTGEKQIGLNAATAAAQSRDMQASIKAAEIAANAAKVSADAVIDAERARMFPFIAKDNFVGLIRHIARDKGLADARVVKKYGDWMTDPYPQLAYCFRNYGKTPAILREIGHGAMISEGFPNVRDFTLLVPLPVQPMIAAAEICDEIVFDSFPNMTAGEARSIVNVSQKTFWFYGYVIYDDTFGWQRTQNFVWHYSAISNGFSLYSYEETEKRRDL